METIQQHQEDPNHETWQTVSDGFDEGEYHFTFPYYGPSDRIELLKLGRCRVPLVKTPDCFNSFFWVTNLVLNNNNLTEITVLPPKLKRLNCSNNQLKQFLYQDVPDTLEDVILDHNQITKLDLEKTNILNLSVSYNQLRGYLVGLPHKLVTFIGDHNKITYFPLIQTLVKMKLGYNRLETCPVLGDKLVEVQLYGNQIETIDKLPESLKYLNFSDNRVSVLPSFPSDLRELAFSGNNVTTVENLPLSLEELYCSSNHIQTLLLCRNKRLYKLSCSHNPELDLVSVPDNLGVFVVNFCPNVKLYAMRDVRVVQKLNHKLKKNHTSYINDYVIENTSAFFIQCWLLHLKAEASTLSTSSSIDESSDDYVVIDI